MGKTSKSWLEPKPIASPGDIIEEKYEVVRELGKGGSAGVFLVKSLTTGEQFAMKILLSKGLDPREAVERFKREATVLSKLNHECLASLYWCGSTPTGLPFLITDFIDGRTLDAVLEEETRLEQGRAVEIFTQICDAMVYAHGLPLIHRDLKPSNILLSGDDRVTIVDFGLAKIISGPDKTNTLTEQGVAMGSPCYMSPEQSRGMPQDHRTDIYSVGCMMYQTLSGTVPFYGKYPMDILMKHVKEPVPPINSKKPDLVLNPELVSIVMKTLKKVPDNRIQTMSELRDALAGVRESK